MFGIGRPLDGSASTERSLLACRGGLEVDVAARMARVGGELLPLTRLEFELLVLLLESRGSVVTANRIARAI